MTKKGGFIDRVSDKLYESGIPDKIDLTIVVQSQDGKRFNRGALLNIGYLEENDYDVYIFMTMLIYYLIPKWWMFMQQDISK